MMMTVKRRLRLVLATLREPSPIRIMRARGLTAPKESDENAEPCRVRLPMPTLRTTPVMQRVMEHLILSSANDL